MKSSKLVNNLNLKRVGILSLMILSLSVGTVKAASEFKLWHESVGDAKPVELEHLKKDSDKAESVKWLVTDPTAENVEKFVSKFSKEPFMFMEGMKEAITEAKKDGKLADLKKMVEEKLFTDKPEGFGIKAGAFKDEDAKTAFKKLAKALFGLTSIDDSFLEKLFKDKKLIQAALNLTQVDPDSVKPSPTPSPTVAPSPSPSVKPSPSPVVDRPRQPAPITTVGEFDDAALQRQAQAICNNLNAKNDEALKALRDQINPLKDALNDAFNKLAEASNAVNPNAQNARRQERGLEDILPGLLANALNKDQQQDVTPAQNSQQPFPQQQSRRDNTDPNAFNQPLPDQGQVPQQPSFPMPQYPSNNNYGPVRLDLPSMTGRQELRDAQDVLTEIQMRQPVASTLGVNAGLPELVMAKARIATLTRKAQGALIAGKDRLSRLDEQLEELKDGGRAALPESAKRKMSELERAVADAKSQMQYQQQVLNMLPPEQKQANMGEILGAQQKVQAAEGALNQYKAEVDIAIESGNAKIKALAKVRDNLQSTVSKLESEVGGLKEEETSIQTLISTNMQMQMNPMQAGTPNVNKLGGFGGGNGSPRTQAPRIGNSLQGATTGAKGSEVRGPLGAKK